jgi:glutamine synthetase
LEFRLTDGRSNIYAALASTIAAMLHGVEQQMSPPVPIDEDIYEWDDKEFIRHRVKTLPQTLGEALQALTADT